MENMEKKFKIYVRAIIKNDKGKILLLKKSNNQQYGAGKYLAPGGTVEFGEDIEETLYRELKEEVNLEIKSLKLFETRKMIIKNEHWLGIYYIVEVTNINDLKNMEPNKHEKCDFFDITKMDNFLYKDMILKYLDKNYD